MMGEIKRYKWTREQMEPLSYGSYVNYVDHAAAILRAKAEGAREMIKIVKANKADQRVADSLDNTVSFDSFNEVLDAITREIDARAAQIEEGYSDETNKQAS